MRLLLACGRDGLLEYRFTSGWRSLACPLIAPSLLACGSGCFIAADNTTHTLWAAGRIFPVDSGLEALMLWRGRALTLSGDTGCVTMLDLLTGLPIITTPCGIPPQDMCLVAQRLLAVCGGADCTLHLLHPDDLTPVRTVPLNAYPQRLAWSGGRLYLLSDARGDAAMSILSIVNHGGIEPIIQLPGAAGALCADGAGGVWCAAGEALLHLPANSASVDIERSGFGLIRHMDSRGGLLLVSDPVLGRCSVLDQSGNELLSLTGDVGQGVLV